MEKRTRAAAYGTVLTLTFLAISFVLPVAGPIESKRLKAQEVEELGPAAETDYVGMTKCAACHYAQFKDWKETSHGKAFEILPKKYQKDAGCLECHSTGFGHPEPAGEAAASNLAGVSCEACHGPGGNHARYALTFVGQGRELTDESLKVLRSKIERTSFEKCIHCHASKAHKPHPEFDRDGTATKGVQTGQRAARSRRFFQVHN